MIRTALARVVCACAILVLTQQMADAAIGKTAGDFNVSQAGTAQYRIPIWTPAGAGGMRPELAITYSHVRENGLLGMGFEVAGFSAITRCSKTIAQDTANGAVKLA